jgi:hypothetical protein
VAAVIVVVILSYPYCCKKTEEKELKQLEDKAKNETEKGIIEAVYNDEVKYQKKLIEK